MTAIYYNNRYFVSVLNSENGDVDGDTRFHYRQQDEILWGTYSGGSIKFGTIVGRVEPDGKLNFRYQHLNQAGEFMSGECDSTPTLLPDGRIRLQEEWRWMSGDQSSGSSIVEEVISRRPD